MTGAPIVFLSIDIKWNPDDKGGRKKLSWRSKDNSDEKLIITIDQIKRTFENENIPLGQIMRYFVSHEWLPATVLKRLELDKILENVDEAKARDVYKKVAGYFAVKRDTRFDLITSPSGRKPK